MNIPTSSIPDWMPQGLLPPIHERSPTSVLRSPYKISISDLVQRFATSATRCDILSGYLKHRRALHELGFHEGFQWINGSFVEQVEAIEARTPQDIDVVTFYALPSNVSESSLLIAREELFHPQLAKSRYKVDAYFVSLNSPARELVSQSTYWYSVWSHKRTWAWKGYLEVDLGADADLSAQECLDAAAEQYNASQEAEL